MERVAFTQLPSTVLRSILTYLQPRELAVCCMTSKFLITYAKGSARRYYHPSSFPSFPLVTICVANYLMTLERIISSLRESYDWIQCNSGSGSDSVNGDERIIRIDENDCLIAQLDLLVRPRILIVGGNLEPNKVDSFDVKSRQWRQWTPTLVGREVFFEVLWYRGLCLVFCGIHHSSYGCVESFDITNGIWESFSALPGKIAAVVGTVLEDRLIVVGGYDWATYEYSDRMYEFVCSAWVLLSARLRYGRSSHACVTFKRRIFVGGGCGADDSCEGTCSVEIYYPESNEWRVGPSFAERRFRLRLFVVADRLYAVAGDRDDKGRLVEQTIVVLSEDETSWEFVVAFKHERRGFSSRSVPLHIPLSELSWS